VLQGILCYGIGRNTGGRIDSTGAAQPIVVGCDAREGLVSRHVQIRVLVGSIAGAVIASLGPQASVTIGVEAAAVIVAIEAILIAAAVPALASEIGVVAHSIIDRRAR